jgi:adenylyl- and sulfurtransferase ThiI
LERLGYVVIESDEPEKVVVLYPEIPVKSMDTNDWFMASLRSLTTQSASSRQEHFINNLYHRLVEKENK